MKQRPLYENAKSATAGIGPTKIAVKQSERELRRDFIGGSHVVLVIRKASTMDKAQGRIAVIIMFAMSVTRSGFILCEAFSFSNGATWISQSRTCFSIISSVVP